MAEGDVYINDKKINLKVEDPDAVIFWCSRVVLKPKEAITEWDDGMPIDFEEFQRLVFTDGKKRVTYSKIRVEEV